MTRNYYTDSRVRAAENRWQGTIGPGMTSTFTLCDGYEEEEDIIVPIRFAVCPTCEGRGTHVNPSIDCDGLTAEDFADDPDFADDYCRGRYDVPCYECAGQRVVPEIDETRIDAQLLLRIKEQQRDDAAARAERNHERAMGY